MRPSRIIAFLAICVAVLGTFLQMVGVPFFGMTAWFALHERERLANERAAPHDLALTNIAVVNTSTLPPADARDIRYEGRATPRMFQIAFTSRNDFEAYIHRTQYSGQAELGPCHDGIPDPPNQSLPDVFDQFGAINEEAVWYSPAPPGSAHELLRHPRPPTSGQTDRDGLFHYRLYVPLAGNRIAAIDGHPTPPADLCFFINDLQKAFSGFRTNTVIIPKARVLNALSETKM